MTDRPSDRREPGPPDARSHRISDSGDIWSLPQPARPTFFFSSFAKFAYGHVARSLKIASEFVARAPFDAHVISSQADFVTADETSRVHLVSLPSFTVTGPGCFTELPTSGLASPIPGTSAEDLPAYRGRLLLRLAEHLQPRGILIDHFPFSFYSPLEARSECVEPLAFLRRRSPATLCCAGFRGVLPRPLRPDEEEQVQRLLGEYIDLMFVYVDERERDDCLRTLPFLRPIEAKLRFVGYVGSRRPGPRATGRAEPTAARWRILATFGSGINAGARARLGCEAFVILAAARPGGSLDVVTGGQLPEPVYRQLVERFAAVDAIRFTRFVPSLAARLDGYDLVLAMGGYNACVELYESSARGIVFPRNSPLDHEQGVQALKFKEYGGVDHVVDLGTTTPAALARLMQESLDSPPTPRTPIDVGGAARTVDILLEELARRSHAP